MKKSILFSLLLVSFFSFAQNKYERADKAFENMQYKEASRLYADAFDKGDNSKELLQKAADSYYLNSDMYSASIWYEKLFLQHKEEEVDSRYAFRFIHSLKGSNQLEKAKILIGYFADSNVLNPIEVEQLKKDYQFTVDEILAEEPSFKVYKLKINTPFSDFGPMFYRDKVVFASARDTMNAHTREYHWNEQSFLDLFIAEHPVERKTKIKDSVEVTRGYRHLGLDNVQSFSGTLNTKYHEAAAAFSPDEQTIYFTRNNYQADEGKNLERDTAGINNLKLYRATIKTDTLDLTKEREWSDIVELPFNSVDYSVGHPSVSKDGSTLYFVSDMPGTLGATDIFKVSINGDGTYGTPENLGPEINTAGREMFPYVTEDKLYFSSDGHIGLGSLDVFEVLMLEEGGYSEPHNLGQPLNSDLDDFGFIINEETQEGYFSSNREGGQGDDDIYSFKREIIIPLVPCVQMAKGTVINRINKKPIANAKVELFDADGKVLEELMTGEDGSFTFVTPLSCETPYAARASKPKYGEDRKEFVTATELGLELAMDLDLGLEVDPIIDLIYDDNGVKKFRIRNLNFDLNKHNIRPDAAAELNKIYEVMNEYPSIVIKIESHTDSRGSDAYNEALSDRRAKSTRDYLISRGISSERIESAIGYGENRLLNECSSGVKCSNEKHDINRRSEFIITKM